MGAQNSNVSPKFPKIGDFQPPQFFVFLDENLRTRRNFSDRLKFRGGA